MQDWTKDDSSSEDEEELTGIEGEDNMTTSESASMLNSTTSNGSLIRLRKCGFCKIKVGVSIKGWELNSATTLASQPAAGHS